MKIEFNSKDTYLAWRTEWKRQYAQTSQNIRDLKFIRKENNRAYSNAEAGLKKEKKPVQDYYAKFQRAVQMYLSVVPGHKERIERCKGLWLDKERKNARCLLETLKLAKAEAQRQYLAAKATVAA